MNKPHAPLLSHRAGQCDPHQRITRELAVPRVALLALTACACGGTGNTPAAPETRGLPTGATLTIIAGDSAQPIQDALVRINTQSLTSNAAGQVSLPAPVPLGSTVDVTAAPILDRQTLIRDAAQMRFVMWPRTTPNGVDEDFTRRVVYMNFGPGGLIRPTATTVTIVPGAEIVSDVTAWQSHLDATGALTRVTAGGITWRVDASAGAGVIIRSIIDPDDPMAITGAGATLQYDGRAIVGGTIVFKALNNARCMGVVLHELGHVYGLGHSLDSRDLMGPGPCFRRDFSDREKVVMNLMLHRRPGNVFPDNDRNVSTASHRGHSSVSCVL